MARLRFWTQWKKRHFLLIAILLVLFSWLAWEVNFRIVTPISLQKSLFGRQIASFTSLSNTYYSCCSMDGGGMLSWTYKISPQLASKLGARCRQPNGQPRDFINVSIPFYDKLTRSCIVARIFSESREEDLTAEVEGNTLTIRMDYLDL